MSMRKTPDEQLAFDYSHQLPQLLTPDEIYDRADTPNILRMLSEDRRIERKSPGYQCSQLGEYFSMWANTSPDGGVIVFGMEDDGRITGLAHLGQSRINDIESTAYRYCPESHSTSKRVPAILEDGTSTYLLVFRVPYEPSKVIRHVNGKAYMRIADKKVELNDEAVRELAIDKGEKPHEEELVDFAYPNDFDQSLLRRFIDNYKRATSGDQLSDIKVLELRRLGKIIGGQFKPNVACALLFAKDPVSLFPGCKVRFLRYEGEHEGTGDDYNVVKDIPIEGPIPSLVTETANALDSQLREFARLGVDGHFLTVPEYPREAWFEALVNALVHRSYGLKTMNVFVKMFDDHLEIESPGGFPPLVTPENIYDMHVPRNPRLMNALYYMQLVREHNEGTKRIRKSMAENSLPVPEFKQMAGSGTFAKVVVTLRNNQKQRKSWLDVDVSKVLGEALTSELTESERLAMNYVGANGSINVSQCLRQVRSLKKWHSAKQLLTRLVNKGLLIHHHSHVNLRDAHACYTLPGKLPPRKLSQQ